ncbi:DUF6516 family protein [Desulfococcaceae bacterium HSG9]|nr:DUF6516 family protein [Desulfococcaceae bacterium HSG9]
MLLSEYLREITETVGELAKTGLILSSDLTADFRTQKIGLIKGMLSFSDDSQLFFKEYVDLRYKIVKETYSFHYQDRDRCLIFRYDNADHKPSPGFTDHKHIGKQVVRSEIPNLREILEEIINDHLTV